MEGRLEPASPEFIAATLRSEWDLPVMTMRRDYLPGDVEGLAWRDGAGEAQGLVTWHIDGHEAEVVTLNAFQPGQHIGGRLLDGGEAELRKRGVRRVFITTTNDNLRAIAFYIRRGYRIVRVELDGMDRVRAGKPGVPLTGMEGVPLRDMLELQKAID
jgi:hypothetical protein